MDPFITHPLDKLMNRENFYDRLQNVEELVGAHPSARINALGEMGISTGTLTVDELLIIDHATGEITIRAFDGGIFAGGGNVQLSTGGIAILDDGGVGNGFLSFYDETGATEWFSFKASDGNMQFINQIAGKSTTFFIKTTDSSTPYIAWSENPSVANQTKFEVLAGASGLLANLGILTIDGGTENRVEIGADHYIPTRNASNKTTIFNEANQDMDFNVQGAADNNGIYFDASTDRLGIGTATPGHKLDVAGSVNVSTGNKFKINGTNIKYVDAFATHLNFATIAAGVTSWASPFLGATVSEAGQLVTRAATAKNFFVRTATAQPGTGTLVFMLRKNGADTAVTFTIAAGAAAGNYSDTSNSVAFAAGDRVAFRIVNNASSASAQIAPLVCDMEFEV